MVRVRLWLGLGLGLELNGVRVIWLGGDCLISYGPVFIRNHLFIDISRVGLGAGNEHNDSVQACGPCVAAATHMSCG